MRPFWGVGQKLGLSGAPLKNGLRGGAGVVTGDPVALRDGRCPSLEAAFAPCFTFIQTSITNCIVKNWSNIDKNRIVKKKVRCFIHMMFVIHRTNMFSEHCSPQSNVCFFLKSTRAEQTNYLPIKLCKICAHILTHLLKTSLIRIVCTMFCFF